MVRRPSPSVSFSIEGHMKCPPLVDPWMCWACGTPGTYPSPWMTTRRSPLSVAVNVAVPVTPLSLASSRLGCHRRVGPGGRDGDEQEAGECQHETRESLRHGEPTPLVKGRELVLKRTQRRTGSTPADRRRVPASSDPCHRRSQRLWGPVAFLTTPPPSVLLGTSCSTRGSSCTRSSWSRPGGGVACRSGAEMTTRPRRPSAYQPRPATLPPGTHFRRASVVPTVDAGPDSENPVLTGDEPETRTQRPVMSEPVVVADPHDAEESPLEDGRSPSRRTRLSVLVLTAVVLVAMSVAYLGWPLVGDEGQQRPRRPRRRLRRRPPRRLRLRRRRHLRYPRRARQRLRRLPSTCHQSTRPTAELPRGHRPGVRRPRGRPVVRSSTPLTALRCRCRPTRSSAMRSSPPTSWSPRTARRRMCPRAWDLSGRHHARRRPPGTPDLPALRCRPALAVAGGPRARADGGAGPRPRRRATSRARDDQLPGGHGAGGDLRRRRGAGAVRPARRHG